MTEAANSVIAPGEEVALPLALSLGPGSGSASARGEKVHELALSEETKLSARRTREEEENEAGGGETVHVDFLLSDGTTSKGEVSLLADFLRLHPASLQGEASLPALLLSLLLRRLQFPLGQDIAYLKFSLEREKSIPVGSQTFTLVGDDGATSSTSQTLIDPMSLADYPAISSAAKAKKAIKIKVSLH